MTTALAFGTRDAKLLYHAGMIKAALAGTTRRRDRGPRAARGRAGARPELRSRRGASAPGRPWSDCHDGAPTLARRPVAAASGSSSRLVLPAVALAHPLGNFTINHYAGIRVEPDRVLLDVVIDQAEIPTFQARLAFDTDGDGEVSDDEADAGRVDRVRVAGRRRSSSSSTARARPSTLTHAGLTFPPGVGGLSTMRLVCEFRADAGRADRRPDRPVLRRHVVPRAPRLARDRRDRLGRDPGRHRGRRSARRAPSDRLTAYPTDQLAQAPADRSLAVAVDARRRRRCRRSSPRMPRVPARRGRRRRPTAGHGQPDPRRRPPSPGAAAGVAGSAPGRRERGGAAVGLPRGDLTPLVLLLSLLTAVALGAGHALTPGHGKTLMAAYLVGTRGTVWHAAGLGLSVTVSHTIGILVLAALVVGAQDVLAPDVVVRGAPFVAAISIVAIGGWMLADRAPAAAGASGDAAHDARPRPRPRPRARARPRARTSRTAATTVADGRRACTATAA